MAQATSYRAQRALTGAEMTSVMTAINAASSTPEILVAALNTVFTALLEPLGESLADYGPTRRLDPTSFAIPFTQWTAISQACMARADAFGGRMHVAIELINVMPASYDDPSAAVPDTPPEDQRPYEHVLTVTREATDVIAAAARHCADLGRYYGQDSREYRQAVASWQHSISQVFSMAFGPQSHVSRDGDLSLLVSTGSGFIYGIIFHPERRRCTADGCQAVINDDGIAWTYSPGDAACPAGQHLPSYPLDAPHPGSWSVHS
jgi:hypothetical protein